MQSLFVAQLLTKVPVLLYWTWLVDCSPDVLQSIAAEFDPGVAVGPLVILGAVASILKSVALSALAPMKPNCCNNRFLFIVPDACQ